MNDSTCSVDDCVKPATRKKARLCEKHYYRQRRWGDVDAVRKVVKYDHDTRCSVSECGRDVFSLGFCSRHYAKYRKYGDAEHPPQPRGPAPKPPAMCSIDGCDGAHRARGMCNPHYTRWRLYGDPHAWMKKIGVDLEARRATQRRFSKTPKGLLKASKRRARLLGADTRQITNSDWLGLVRRYRGCCAYCGASDKPLTREHIIPLARGGRHAIGNLLPVCGSCNSSKADRLLVEWRARRKHSIAA